MVDNVPYNYPDSYPIVSNGGLLTLTGVGDGVMSKTIPDSGGVTKSGSGTWTLAGSNTYTGPTAINAGELVVNGSLTSA